VNPIALLLILIVVLIVFRLIHGPINL